jgi:hypothetical protein
VFFVVPSGFPQRKQGQAIFTAFSQGFLGFLTAANHRMLVVNNTASTSGPGREDEQTPTMTSADGQTLQPPSLSEGNLGEAKDLRNRLTG